MANTEKLNFINKLSNKLLFFDGNLYQIVRANMCNIYVKKYKIDKHIIIDTNILFYTICSAVIYTSFLNEFEERQEKLKTACVINEKYVIIEPVQDVSDMYFIQNNCNNNSYSCIEMKTNYMTSLFNLNSDRLKDIYELRTWVKSLNGKIINIQTDYYKNIKADLATNKLYYNSKYNPDELRIMLEISSVSFCNPVSFNDFEII